MKGVLPIFGNFPNRGYVCILAVLAVSEKEHCQYFTGAKAYVEVFVSEDFPCFHFPGHLLSRDRRSEDGGNQVEGVQIQS